MKCRVNDVWNGVMVSRFLNNEWLRLDSPPFLSHSRADYSIATTIPSPDRTLRLIRTSPSLQSSDLPAVEACSKVLVREDVEGDGEHHWTADLYLVMRRSPKLTRTSNLSLQWNTLWCGPGESEVRGHQGRAVEVGQNGGGEG
jgi:hypothetical protein